MERGHDSQREVPRDWATGHHTERLHRLFDRSALSSRSGSVAAQEAILSTYVRQPTGTSTFHRVPKSDVFDWRKHGSRAKEPRVTRLAGTPSNQCLCQIQAVVGLAQSPQISPIPPLLLVARWLLLRLRWQQALRLEFSSDKWRKMRQHVLLLRPQPRLDLIRR